MDALFTSVSTVITKMIELLGTVSTALLSNSIFQLMVGIAVLFIVIGLVFRLVKKCVKVDVNSPFFNKRKELL